MWNVIKRGVEISKATVRMLVKHPHLLVMPLMSMLTLALFAVGVLCAKHAQLIHFGKSIALIYLVPTTFLLSMVQMFWGVALGRAVLRTLHGEDASLTDAVAFAVKKLPAVLGYSAIAATFGIVLALVERVASKAGAYIARFVFGFSWSIATFLIIPVMVQEERGVVGSLRRSNELVQKTLGERLVGELGLPVALLVPTALAVFSIQAAFHMRAAEPVLALAIMLVAGTAAIIALTLGVAARTLYSIALYQSAVEGIAPSEFDAAVQDARFQTR